MDNKGHISNAKSLKKREEALDIEQLVLEKSIFSNVFEKDIRRVYIYKKSEMIAKAIHLISPAFKDSKALRDRLQRISVEIIDASVLPPSLAREALSRELLTLSSILRMAKTAGILSSMNADIIMRETHELLQEVSTYEDPKVTLEDAPSLATLTRTAGLKAQVVSETFVSNRQQPAVRNSSENKGQYSKGQKEVKKDKSGRREAILSILKSKGPSYIKDLSTMIREVSEKTIQRELQALVLEGRVSKSGERRWTTYTYNPSLSDSLPEGESSFVAVDESLSVG
jgi:hypothetical protein